MDDWWGDIENEILGCLAVGAPVRPDELADKLGMSESAVTSLLSMLAHDGKVRICLVERSAPPARRSATSASHGHPRSSESDQGWAQSA